MIEPVVSRRVSLWAAVVKVASVRRWILLMGGLFLFGCGIAAMVRSEMGLSSWDIFHQGLSHRIGLQIGTVNILVGVVILIAWIPLRERPGIATVLNTLVIGLVVNWALTVFPVPAGLVWRFIWTVGGVALIGVGSALYLSADFGAGPRDGLMMGLHRRTGLSIRLVRTLLELSVLLVGWLMGGTVGIGTLAFAFGVGPIIQFVLPLFRSEPKQQVSG